MRVRSEKGQEGSLQRLLRDEIQGCMLENVANQKRDVQKSFGCFGGKEVRASISNKTLRRDAESKFCEDKEDGSRVDKNEDMNKELQIRLKGVC